MMLESTEFVRNLIGGKELPLSWIVHCSAKKSLKIVAFCKKSVTYKLFSMMGGIFVVFFLFESFLNALQKCFSPVEESESEFPSFLKYEFLASAIY